ncbi:MAG: integron integrase [Gemmatimonadetes bacterium]|nr:integron integrase [Gemmatimonadota bacterium]
MPSPTPPRLIDQIRQEMRLLHRSPRIEKTYIWWTRKFIRFHQLRHPNEMDERDVRRFITHIASEERCSASTQNQALAALKFLFDRVLRRELDWDHENLHAKRPQHVPDTLSIAECNSVMDHLVDEHRLAAMLLWGSGLRVSECLTLRLKDVNLARRTLTVHAGKGDKDRMTPLAERALPELKRQMERARARYREDRKAHIIVGLPNAFGAKDPGAASSEAWYWLFPSTRTSRDPRGRQVERWYLHPSGLQRAVKQAAAEAGLTVRVHCHCFRHSFATQLLERGTDLRTIRCCLATPT